MIEILNIEEDQQEEDYIIYTGKSEVKEIKIIKYNNETHFEISTKDKHENKLIETLTSSFENFLKFKAEYLPFNLELNTVPLDGENIANFSPIFRIIYDCKEAEIAVDLIYQLYSSMAYIGRIPHTTSESKWSTNYILTILNDINTANKSFTMYGDENRSRYGIKFKFKKEQVISDCLQDVIKLLADIEKELSIRINSFNWKEQYDNDELKFNREVLLPLLRKMKLDNVRYTHGTNEFGKDLVFTLKTKFIDEIHIAIQSKAGNVSGRANRDIEELINQIKIAFKNPFTRIANDSKYYISIIIIAISGKFTNQAEKRLLAELPVEYKGSVKFWDKEKILELIEKHWIE